MKLRNLKNCLSTFLIVSFILFCFTGCRMRAEQKSLTGQFDVIDALIMQNQMQSALKELKKTEKRAYDVWSFIGIYKRYAGLGESEKAEKLMKKALKKHGNSEELLAIYAAFLMRGGRLAEVGKFAEKLRGTKYASIYSEYILRESAIKFAGLASAEDSYSYYQKKDFYQIYLDAYKTSKILYGSETVQFSMLQPATTL